MSSGARRAHPIIMGTSITDTIRSATRAGPSTNASNGKFATQMPRSGSVDDRADQWRICCRAWVEMRAFRQHLHELTAEWRNAVGRHPRALGAALVIFAVLTAGSLAGLILFYNSLRRGLPGEDAVRHIFEMSEATAVY